jgi:hypothetical protein
METSAVDGFMSLSFVEQAGLELMPSVESGTVSL